MKVNQKNNPKRIKLCLFATTAALLLFATSCSKDSPLNPNGNCFGGNWATQYADELEDWSDAAEAYAENPTPANCTAYKNAAKAYLDALENIYGCVPTVSRGQIDDAIEEAKDDVDNESCE